MCLAWRQPVAWIKIAQGGLQCGLMLLSGGIWRFELEQECAFFSPVEIYQADTRHLTARFEHVGVSRVNCTNSIASKGLKLC